MIKKTKHAGLFSNPASKQAAQKNCGAAGAQGNFLKAGSKNHYRDDRHSV